MLLMACACAAQLWVSAASAQVIRVQDDRGVTVEFWQAPQRVVSLLPSLTESVCALGACGRLVGVDRYSNFPDQVRQLPQLGGGLDPQLERVVLLKPDVVLVALGTRVVEPLQRLGIPVLAFDTQNMADVERVLRVLQQVLNTGDANALIAAVQADIQAAAKRVELASPSITFLGATKIRVYYEVSPGPYAAGPASFMGQLLSRLGAENIVQASLGAFPKLNPEFVVRANPDLIMIHEAHAAGLTQRVGWKSIKALQTHRVCRFTPQQSDVLERPGPRMGQAAQLLADCLLAQAKPKASQHP
jgi:iron complex transport system substrate-binding protein